MPTGVRPIAPRSDTPREGRAFGVRPGEPAPAARPVGPYRVVLVDSNPVLIQGLRHLLNTEDDFCVCGACSSSQDALARVVKLSPDAVITDVELNGENVIALAKAIRLARPQCRVIVYAHAGGRVYAERLRRAGASGYLLKTDTGAAVVAGIRAILQQREDEPAVPAFGVDAGPQPASAIDRLTDRELEIFRAIAAGLPNRNIARQLRLSVKTVASHREHIKAKLDLPNSAALERFAVQWEQSAGLERPAQPE